MAALKKVVRGDLTFDVYEDGPADGTPVLLLHGFPQHASSWDPLVPLLTEQGYRTLAMNQRGYTPGATPAGNRRRDYKIPELVADAAAVADELAGGRAHVVGHDWGAAVAWGFAAAHPEKTRSLTALSVPHVGAFLSAMWSSPQILKSWYMGMFQLPWIPERILGHRYDLMLRYFGQSPEKAKVDGAEFDGPAAFTGPLNFYRAMPLTDLRAAFEKVSVPTLFIASDGDVAIDEKGVRNCGKYVTGPYRQETLHGVSHWILDEAPAEAAALLLPHLKEYS
jgi:pimeloyl-ACP methyl ester carboxylesterase